MVPAAGRHLRVREAARSLALRIHGRTMGSLSGVFRAEARGDALSMIEVLQVETEFAQLRALYEKTSPAGVLEIGTYQGGTLREWLTHGDPLGVVAVDIDHVNPGLYEGWRQPHTFLQVVTGDSRSPEVKAQI